jgi:flagellar basal body-associated protein FliL
VPDSEKQFTPTKGPTRRTRFGVPLFLIALAATGFWFWRSQSGDAARADSVSPVQSTLHLETFVLNLADSDQRAYLRVGIDLGLDQDSKHAQELVPIAEVRDTILGTLGEAKVDDLMTSAGKANLKENVLHALQQRVPDLRAREVYFTECLIQR